MEIINRPHLMANLYSHHFPYNYVTSSHSNSTWSFAMFGQRDVGRSLTKTCKLLHALMHDWVWTLYHCDTAVRTHRTSPLENEQSMQLWQVA